MNLNHKLLTTQATGAAIRAAISSNLILYYYRLIFDKLTILSAWLIILSSHDVLNNPEIHYF
jgi:hypothetical protein